MTTFNGTTLRIILDAPTAGVLNLDVQNDLYEPWKLFQLGNGFNRGLPPAFTTSGGEPITIDQNSGDYYFLRNDLGWRLQSTDEDQDIFIDGNIVPTDTALRVVVSRPTRTITFIGLQPITVGIRTVGVNVLLARELLESDQVFDQAAGLLHYYRKGTLVDLIPAKTVVTTQTQDTSLVE